MTTSDSIDVRHVQKRETQDSDKFYRTDLTTSYLGIGKPQTHLVSPKPEASKVRLSGAFRGSLLKR